MSSQKRIDASRKNGALGGPKTPKGKAVSSRNACKHSLATVRSWSALTGFSNSRAMSPQRCGKANRGVPVISTNQNGATRRALSCRSSSSPVMPGIIKSEISKSTACPAMSSTAARPVVTLITSWPSSRSSAAMFSAKLGSSSTIRTRSGCMQRCISVCPAGDASALTYRMHFLPVRSTMQKAEQRAQGVPGTQEQGPQY